MGKAKRARSKAPKVPTERIEGFSVREIRPGYWRVDKMLGGKRVRQCFAAHAEAVTFCRAKSLEIVNLGRQVLDLPDRARRDALEALKLIDGTGKTLVEIAKDYMRRNPSQSGETVRQTADRYLAEMAKAGRRSASIDDKRWRLNALCEALGDRPTAGIDKLDLTQWTTTRRWTGRTERAYMGAAETLLRFFRGESRRRHRTADETPPVTWSVEAVSALFAKAQAHTPDLVPALALLFFAGLRPNEMLRLRREHIDLDARLIRLSGDITKTRTMRNVEISDNLAAWLKQYGVDAAIVRSATSYRKKREKLMRVCKIAEWPTDVPRHTFATMLYAATDDAAKVAAQLGHFGNVDTFARHYKGCPVTAQDAAAFFAIVPHAGKTTAEAYFQIKPKRTPDAANPVATT